MVESSNGQRLRALREQKGIGQTKLAEMTGLNRTHIAMLENGKRGGTADVWRRLADALETTTDYLYGRVEGPDLPESPRYPVPAPDIADIVARMNELPEELRSQMGSSFRALLKMAEQFARQPRLTVRPAVLNEERASYGADSQREANREQLARIWAMLTPAEREELYEMAVQMRDASKRAAANR